VVVEGALGSAAVKNGVLSRIHDWRFPAIEWG
jgi:hypothetical protein